jgi:hypothetical protein
VAAGAFDHAGGDRPAFGQGAGGNPLEAWTLTVSGFV